jgi:hypothetical protein
VRKFARSTCRFVVSFAAVWFSKAASDPGCVLCPYAEVLAKEMRIRGDELERSEKEQVRFADDCDRLPCLVAGIVLLTLWSAVCNRRA